MSKNISACLSHKSDDWRTPSWLYDKIVNQLGFEDLFPFNADFNQFDREYKSQRLFINPPYSKMKQVVKYVNDLLDNNNSIILLVPSRTDTVWFNLLVNMLTGDDYLIFIQGRLKFNDALSAPFPSALFVFNFDLETLPCIHFYSQRRLSELLDLNIDIKGINCKE